ncbi:MAG: hypothetical protein M3076_21190 [Actinomycetota bacterium]|nr:hypothetical protein [Actinomycetota bacterium]
MAIAPDASEPVEPTAGAAGATLIALALRRNLTGPGGARPPQSPDIRTSEHPDIRTTPSRPAAFIRAIELNGHDAYASTAYAGFLADTVKDPRWKSALIRPPEHLQPGACTHEMAADHREQRRRSGPGETPPLAGGQSMRVVVSPRDPVTDASVEAAREGLRWSSMRVGSRRASSRLTTAT